MFFNLHTHSKIQLENVVSIVNQFPSELDFSVPYYSVGIHPWYINKTNLNEDLEIIDSNLTNSNCFALGECGLDKRSKVDFQIQIEVFKKQIIIAKKHKKPLILHCVGAFQEVINFQKEFKIDVPIIIHGFSKNEQVANSLIKNGFYLSFGKYLLRNPELENVFKNIPNDRFLLETDTIEETIFEVYTKASTIKNIDIEKQVTENFNKIFNVK